VTSFNVEGLRALGTALNSCADILDQQVCSPLSQSTLSTWHAQPADGYREFTSEWSRQLQSAASDLRTMADGVGNVVAVLTEGDSDVAAALGSEA
jgi:hypothetical protein